MSSDTQRMRRVRHPALTVLAVGYLNAVLWITLGPVPWAQAALADNPLGILNVSSWTARETWVGGRPLEFLMNIAMFVPLGVFAAMLGQRRSTLLVPFAVTVAIELAQILLPDRASDPRDLVANAIGAGAGLLIGRALHRRRVTPHAFADTGVALRP